MKDYSSIIVSSRVRLMRNLSGFKFPSMTDGDGIKVLNKVADYVLSLSKKFKIYKISSLSNLDVNVMREKKLVTTRLIEASPLSAVILSEDEKISVMINESDHIVEGCTASGFNLFGAYDTIKTLDREISANLDIAFDDTLGFLTSNINCCGTGMKASVTMFLPALVLNDSIDIIISKSIAKGFEVNSFEDEKKQPKYFYTFSNANTISGREIDFINSLTELAVEISNIEIDERKKFLGLGKIDGFIDMIYRDWGILTNCYKISADEAVKLLGELKIGVALDIIRLKDVSVLENLMVDILPYSLTKISDSKISMAELDKYRAKYISNVLNFCRIK